MKLITPSKQFYTNRPNLTYNTLGPSTVILEDHMLPYWEQCLQENYKKEEYDIEDVTGVMLDLGGMLSTNAATSNISISGIKYECYLHQADLIVPYLSKVQPEDKFTTHFGPYVFFPGHFCKVILSKEVADKLSDFFQAQALTRNKEVDEYWKDREDKLSKLDNILYASREEIEKRVFKNERPKE